MPIDARGAPRTKKRKEEVKLSGSIDLRLISRTFSMTRGRMEGDRWMKERISRSKLGLPAHRLRLDLVGACGSTGRELEGVRMTFGSEANKLGGAACHRLVVPLSYGR